MVVIAGLVVGVIGFLAIYPVVGPKWAGAVAIIKILVPLVYFRRLFDGTWVLKDDLTYLEDARALLDQGWDPVSLWSRDGIAAMYAIIDGGQHILYTWLNVLAQYCFGQHYSAPVMLNVGLTFVAALGVYRIISSTSVPRIYIKYLILFFLLHWDVVAWSSFQNRKDILILTLTIGVFAGIVGLWLSNTDKRKQVAYGLVVMICVAGLGVSRFYAPLLIACTVCIWLFITFPLKRTVPAAIVTGILVLIVSLHFLPDDLSDELQHITLNSSTVVWGLVRFPLTPRPWGIEEGYTFVTLSAWLHWIMFVPMLYGGAQLWKDSSVARLLLIHFLVVVVFYAFVPFLQDDRHRLQAVLPLVWAQFHFIYILIQGVSRKACH